jgi:hypothetical protein
VEIVTWETALTDLRGFIPSAVDYSSPDRLSAAADAMVGPSAWQAIRGWEDLPDLDILDQVYAGQPPLAGPVIVVTDHVFSSRGSPARLPAERLREFVAGYVGSAGESFFNGDVVILATEVGRLTVFHHEGVFAHWDLGHLAIRGGHA